VNVGILNVGDFCFWWLLAEGRVLFLLMLVLTLCFRASREEFRLSL